MKHRIAFALFAVLLLSACRKELKPVSVVIVDPVRHYYPVIQGESMGVTYEFENTCDDPLFIREVQTTCGCIVPRDELPILVLPHKSGFLHLEFNTIKNTGYVQHQVYCYGNFCDSGYVALTFDTNVVPRADYVRDYEQLWTEQYHRDPSLREFVDGLTSQKGYYTDQSIDPRQQRQHEVQKQVDSHAF